MYTIHNEKNDVRWYLVDGSNFLVASLGLPIIHTIGIIDRGVAATVAVCLDVLGNANTDRHWPHGDRTNSRHLALSGHGMVVVRVAEAPARVACEGLRLPKSNTNTDGVEGNTLAT